MEQVTPYSDSPDERGRGLSKTVDNRQPKCLNMAIEKDNKALEVAPINAHATEKEQEHISHVNSPPCKSQGERSYVSR